jgi:N-acetylglucosaminyl-diphospho-decaprenol L-rhamnosyltransferase
MPSLGIVIVNYRTPEMLRDCLRSIFMSEGVSPSVCVVDNASGDESAAMVRRDFPQVSLFVQPGNQGYAFANNIGLQHFGFSKQAGGAVSPDTPDYILLLNPDTLLPPTALAEMIAFMEARPYCGAAGPKLIRADGALDKACRRSFPSPEVSFWRLTGLSKLFPKHERFGRYNLTYIDEDQTIEVDSVVGAFMLMRREALQQAGLLDDTFFMYGEDLDLAYRIKQAGWQIWYNAAVTVMHYKGSSSKQVSSQSIVHFYEAMRIFHRKHYHQSLPHPLNVAIESAIWALCRLMLVRNALRKPEQRGVASAV